MFKAQRFRPIITFTLFYNEETHPELYKHQNPAENLNPEEVIDTVRYIVPLEEIINPNVNVDLATENMED